VYIIKWRILLDEKACGLVVDVGVVVQRYKGLIPGSFKMIKLCFFFFLFFTFLSPKVCFGWFYFHSFFLSSFICLSVTLEKKRRGVDKRVT